MSKYWNDLNSEIIKVFDDFNEAIKKKNFEFPDFRNTSDLFIASDYSGEHKTANYVAYSFLIGDSNQLKSFDVNRQEVREKYNITDRTVAFKKLSNDNLLEIAITEFLRSTDLIPGLLLVFLVNKNIEGLFKNIDPQKIPIEEFHNWKSKDFKKLVWILYLMSFFVAGLSKKEQSIKWLTDQDNIVANENRLVAVSQYFASVLGSFIPHPLEYRGVITTENDNEKFDKEDLVSIPDLAGGALTELLTVHSNENNIPDDKTLVALSNNLSPKTTKLGGWLAENNFPLKKLFFRVEENEVSEILNYYKIYIE